jgi:hypothetical protein
MPFFLELRVQFRKTLVVRAFYCLFSLAVLGDNGVLLP